jgi:hypothetical protein
MARRIVAAIRRSLERPYEAPPVHFHTSNDPGYPEVCYVGNCERPRLSV